VAVEVFWKLCGAAALAVFALGTREVRGQYLKVCKRILNGSASPSPGHTLRIAMVASFAAGTLYAQVEGRRSFDVASVRLTGAQTTPLRSVTNARVDLVNISLRDLVLRAFNITRLDRLSAPSWLQDVNVEIHATIPAGGARAQVPEMLETLLITRFGLRAHTEPRPTDVYELVVDRGDIRIEEVQAANELEKAFPADPSGKPPALDRTANTIDGPVRSIATERGGLTFITDRSMYERTPTDRGTIQINAVRMTMAELAGVIETTVDRSVFDRTSLTGVYRFRIELPRSSLTPAMSLGVTRSADGTPITDPGGVSVFKAVEQLGLKLEPRRVPLNTIVVDKIERFPTEN
jgi:uncharacterized protein (TIGR03435 family)